MDIRDLYLRVMAAVESAHPSVKADVDAAFADHAAANTPEQAAPAAEQSTDAEGA